MMRITFGVGFWRMKIIQSNDPFLHSSSVFLHVQRFVGDLILINLHSGIPLECKQVI